MNKIILICFVGLLSACSTYSNNTKSEEEKTYPFVRLAPSPPPKNILEQKLIPTKPMKQIWREGHWDYDGRKFIWVKGEYILRPDPTASWVADRWEKHSYGWGFIPGHWK